MILSIIEVRYITGLNDRALRAEQMKLVFQSDSISVLIGSLFFFFPLNSFLYFASCKRWSVSQQQQMVQGDI